MQANETNLQDIIEGTKQYIVPLFQRTYSWGKKEWEILWDDLLELSEMDEPRNHFIGSIVNMPTPSVPEGITKYVLIDGQQRITTLLLILVVLRDRAKENNNPEFAEEINNTLLVNQYKKGNDHLKIMPTHVDRQAFHDIILGKQPDPGNPISQAYSYFDKKLRQFPVEPGILKKIIINYLSFVSIVLDANDNPYLVFESLNAKGRPLTQADLIKNYFFMRIHLDRQEEVYKEHWKPMEDELGENLTEYIRHFLMKDGELIRQSDVYYALKERVSAKNALDFLQDMSAASRYYRKLLNPATEENPRIRYYLERLKRIEVTTTYPLLLHLYRKLDAEKITVEDMIETLDIIENFLIRRFVCGIPTNQLNKIFPPLIAVLEKEHAGHYPASMKNLLLTKGYPNDTEFRQRLLENNMYRAGDRGNKTKLILETIEASFGHKETVPFAELTIEHIMPQTLSQWWQDHLGDEWDSIYQLYIHNIGNLTLTAYNTELSNDDYPTKREFYCKSHLELNRYFKDVDSWKKEDIEKRAAYLADKALTTWPFWGSVENGKTGSDEVTGKTPQEVCILGQCFQVKNWRDVLENTMNTIADLEPEKFQILLNEYPRLLGKDKNRFRAFRELRNGVFIEVNFSAKEITRLCQQALETIDLDPKEDWKVQAT